MNEQQKQRLHRELERQKKAKQRVEELAGQSFYAWLVQTIFGLGKRKRNRSKQR